MDGDVTYVAVRAQKKDKYRRKGLGRRCYLGDKIYPIPCCSYFELWDDFEEQEEFILFFKSSWGSSSYSSNRPITKQLAQHGIDEILSPKQQR